MKKGLSFVLVVSLVLGLCSIQVVVAIATGDFSIYSHDGTQVLFSQVDNFLSSLTVTETGAVLSYYSYMDPEWSDTYTFTYSGSSFAGFATSANAETAVYTVGNRYTNFGDSVSLYIVESNTSDEISQKLSGVWRFNDELTYDSTLDGTTQEISFMSGEFSWENMHFNSFKGDDGLFYDTLDLKCIIDSNSGTALGWIESEYQIVDFGATPQAVSNEFYTWFIANAVQQEQTLAYIITGDAVPNATSYELYEVMENPNAGGGILDIETGDISGTQNKIYMLKATSSTLYFNLTTLGLSAGSHVFVVKAKADGYLDSDYSNEVIYTVQQEYSVDGTVTNGSLRGLGEDEPATSVMAGESLTIRVVNNIDYTLPETVTVTMGGEVLTSGYTYDNETGVIVIESVTGNIEITATCLEVPSGYTVTIDSGFSYSYISGGDASITLTNINNVIQTVAINDLSSSQTFSNIKSISFSTGGDGNGSLSYRMGDVDGTLTEEYYSAILTANMSLKSCSCACLTGDTLITVVEYDEKKKKRIVKKRLDSMKSGDVVLTLNPFTKQLEESVVVYSDSKEEKTFTQYDVWTFEDGTVVKTVHRHRLFNVEAGKFVHMDKWKIGEHAYKLDGSLVALVSHEVVKEVVKHYTIITSYNSYFANDLLSGTKNAVAMRL